MKLRSVKIEGFKGIKECSFDFTDTTMLVGANNAGKSSILQAIHLAARTINQAPEANKQSTLSLSEAEYVPSETYRELGHHAQWGNFSGTPESKISFAFVDPADGTDANASVILKSARNEGISVSPTINQKLIPILRAKDSMFSAYIPGIAGIPLSEALISTRHVFRKAASGDSNVVLRNILLKIKQNGKLEQLLGYVQDIYPGVKLDVSFNETSDFVINVSVTFGGPKGATKPLEFSGAGFIHVLQIFSYLVLFRPRVILIDEPESHLHPTLQTLLVRRLQQRVQETGAVALITTHSPFVARGLPLGSRSVWISNGAVAAVSSDHTIRDALGWGALDKSVLFCTEDSQVHQLMQLVSQTETLIEKVAPFPFDGVSKLGAGSALHHFAKALGSQHKVVVHRDRDCMTDAELEPWKAEYTKYGVIPWVTDGSDIEMYSCEPQYIAAALGIAEPHAQEMIDQALSENEAQFRSTFTNKRGEINKRLYEKVGGSPSTDELWTVMSYAQRVRGKDLLSKIRSIAKEEGHDEKALGRLAKDCTMAKSLVELLNTLV